MEIKKYTVESCKPVRKRQLVDGPNCTNFRKSGISCGQHQALARCDGTWPEPAHANSTSLHGCFTRLATARRRFQTVNSNDQVQRFCTPDGLAEQSLNFKTTVSTITRANACSKRVDDLGKLETRFRSVLRKHAKPMLPARCHFPPLLLASLALAGVAEVAKFALKPVSASILEHEGARLASTERVKC